MLPFKFFSLEVVEELGLLAFDNPHELVDLEAESIEVCAIHAIERVIHEVLEDLVNRELIITQF